MIKRYRLLKPVVLGFATAREQHDSIYKPEHGIIILSDGKDIFISNGENRARSITTVSALELWVRNGSIEELPGITFPKEWEAECFEWQRMFACDSILEDLQDRIREFVLEQTRAGNASIGLIEDLLDKQGAPEALQELVRNYVVSYCPYHWRPLANT